MHDSTIEKKAVVPIYLEPWERRGILL